jgi:uncharacterized protein (UPF0254 family)
LNERSAKLEEAKALAEEKDTEIALMEAETKAKEEQLATMATAKADLEALAEEREAQLAASRQTGEEKEKELQVMRCFTPFNAI